MSAPPSRRMVLVILVLLIAGESIYLFLDRITKKATIGSTAEVTELDSGITFLARVDTGAAFSSLHFEELSIEEESIEAHDNIGKQIKVLLKNKRGHQEWIRTRIIDYNTIYNAEGKEQRYFVRLNLLCQGVTLEALFTLNDRSAMGYPMLIGREFLRNGYVVDVEKDDRDIN